MHNEISFCWEGTSQSQADIAYWYSSAEHKTSIPMADASSAFNTYAIDWSASAINWSINGKIVHTDTGTMPSEKMQFGFIIR